MGKFLHEVGLHDPIGGLGEVFVGVDLSVATFRLLFTGDRRLKGRMYATATAESAIIKQTHLVTFAERTAILRQITERLRRPL